MMQINEWEVALAVDDAIRAAIRHEEIAQVMHMRNYPDDKELIAEFGRTSREAEATRGKAMELIFGKKGVM